MGRHNIRNLDCEFSFLTKINRLRVILDSKQLIKIEIPVLYTSIQEIKHFRIVENRREMGMGRIHKSRLV